MARRAVRSVAKAGIERGSRAGRLPYFLFLGLVASVAGLLVWLTLASRDFEDRPQPVVDIALDPATGQRHAELQRKAAKPTLAEERRQPETPAKIARTPPPKRPTPPGPDQPVHARPSDTPSPGQLAARNPPATKPAKPAPHKPVPKKAAPKKAAPKVAAPAPHKPAPKKDPPKKATPKVATPKKPAAKPAPQLADRTTKPPEEKSKSSATTAHPPPVPAPAAHATPAPAAHARKPATPPEATTETKTAAATPHAPKPIATADPAPAKVPAAGKTAPKHPAPKAPDEPVVASAKPVTKASTPTPTVKEKAAAAPDALAPRFSLPKIVASGALPAAPDPALIAKSPAGPLPVIGTGNRMAWKVYARPFDAKDKRPRIAVIIGGLGLNEGQTALAIKRLPGPVTLAFVPYADKLGEWIRMARDAGHEVLLSVPMEPQDYPAVDPGPKTLLTTLETKENRARLLWALGRATGYVGVADFMGSRFTTSRLHLLAVFRELKKRGLMFVDSRSAGRSAVAEIAADIGLPWAISTLRLDAQPNTRAIDQDLGTLEKRARDTGRAIGFGAPYPVTLDRVARWVRELESKGIALAPVTALAEERR